MSKNLLLDTCALIWLATGSKSLGPKARAAIAEAQHVYVSSISAFEIAHKNARGGIELPCAPEQWFNNALRVHDVQEIELNSAILIAAAALPLIHKDPCDRFIIATAQLHGLTVVSGDSMFRKYGVKVLA